MGRSGVNWSADGGLVHVVCFPGRVQGQNLGNYDDPSRISSYLREALESLKLKPVGNPGQVLRRKHFSTR
jgi:hypothetical protein